MQKKKKLAHVENKVEQFIGILRDTFEYFSVTLSLSDFLLSTLILTHTKRKLLKRTTRSFSTILKPECRIIEAMCLVIVSQTVDAESL
jgi:hypothetical protein